MTDLSRRLAGGALLLLLIVLLVIYRETFASMWMKWGSDNSFSHGYLIVPISLWLVWSKRHALAAVPWRSEWTGVVVLALLGAAWFVARATGVLVGEQYAAVLMVAALTLAVLGRRATAVILFPLLFLLLAVPAGRGIVPWLMQNTADMAVAALRLSGVPVVRDGMILSIPGGNFEVARACSGLNYLVTGIALGALYAYLTYRSTRKRVLFMLAALIMPIVLNGIRAYLIIAIAHLTDMRWGTGYEHIVFGRALFLVTLFLLFWVGLRWRDPPAGTVPVSPAQWRSGPESADRVAWVAVAACVAVLAVPPAYLRSANAHARSDTLSDRGQIVMPGAAADWKGPQERAFGWRPLYAGAVAERTVAYAAADGRQVDVFVATYGIGMSHGSEMISYRNRLSQLERESLLPHRKRRISLPDGELAVREYLLHESSGTRVVWRWYMVGNRSYDSEFRVKAAEALAYLAGGDATDRVFVLSALADPNPEGASERLEAFVSAHADCILAGFAPGGCTAR